LKKIFIFSLLTTLLLGFSIEIQAQDSTKKVPSLDPPKAVTPLPATTPAAGAGTIVPKPSTPQTPTAATTVPAPKPVLPPGSTVPPIYRTENYDPTPTTTVQRKRKRLNDTLVQYLGQMDSTLKVSAVKYLDFKKAPIVVVPPPPKPAVVVPPPAPVVVKKDTAKPIVDVAPIVVPKDTGIQPTLVVNQPALTDTGLNKVNPFDRKKGENPADSIEKQKGLAAGSKLVDKNVLSKNFLFFVFLVVYLLLGFVISRSRSLLSNIYQSLASENNLRNAYKEQSGWGSFAYLPLYIFFWINGGIFVNLLVNHYGVKLYFVSQFANLLLCIVGVALVFIVKHAVLWAIATIFPVTKAIKQYNFIIILSCISIGLILAPLNIFIAYARPDIGQLLIYVAFAAIILVYLVRSLRSLAVGSPYFANIFHFILYLCTVEVAPVLVLVKLLLGGVR
jgi:hypothetical protein